VGLCPLVVVVVVVVWGGALSGKKSELQKSQVPLSKRAAAPHLTRASPRYALVTFWAQVEARCARSGGSPVRGVFGHVFALGEKRAVFARL
jgi:hypothetical protein